MRIWALIITVVGIEYKKTVITICQQYTSNSNSVLLRYQQYSIIVLQLFKPRIPRNDGIKIKPIEYNNVINESKVPT